MIGIDDEDDSTFTLTVDQKTFHFQGMLLCLVDGGTCIVQVLVRLSSRNKFTPVLVQLETLTRKKSGLKRWRTPYSDIRNPLRSVFAHKV